MSQVQNYYPFDGDMGDTTMNYTTAPNNLYKYSGKELQTELNLVSYDFGARHYDSRLCRWMTMDPLGIASDELSPYNYVENNPMNLIDPDGMQPDPNAMGWGGMLPGVNINSGTSAGSNVGAFGWGLAGANAAFQFGAANKAFDINKKVTSQDFSAAQKAPLSTAIISQWQPNGYDKWKDSGSFGKFTYGLFDEPYVALRSVFWPGSEVIHLNGQFATPKEMQGAFVNTAVAFIPLGRGGYVAKSVLENIAEHAAIDLVEKTTVKASTVVIKKSVQLSVHAIERLAGRESGITNKMIDIAIEKGEKFYDPANKSIVHIIRNGFASGKSLLVATNPLTGSVNTIIKGTFKKIMRPRFIPIK